MFSCIFNNFDFTFNPFWSKPAGNNKALILLQFILSNLSFFNILSRNPVYLNSNIIIRSGMLNSLVDRNIGICKWKFSNIQIFSHHCNVNCLWRIFNGFYKIFPFSPWFFCFGFHIEFFKYLFPQFILFKIQRYCI